MLRFESPHFAARVLDYAPGLRLRRHAHEHAHFCFVLHGNYEEDLCGRSRKRQREDLMFYPPDTPHGEDHATGSRHLVVEIGQPIWSRANQASSIAKEPLELRSLNGRAIARRLISELRRNDDLMPLQIEALVLELLVETARPSRRSYCPVPPWVQVAEEFIRNNLFDTMTLANIAEAAQVHPVYLSRAFRKHQGTTVGEFIRRLRVEAAQRLLANTGSSLAAIASECGFADQSHLFRVFRSIVGISPAEYRRRR
jgi:AraC family transcriptional regulator